jgi:hypothetical protein
MRCDKIATAHLDAANQPIPTVTFLPASQVSLSVGTVAITHHIPTQLRYFAGLAGLRERYCKHHEWASPAVFDLIAWPIFHQATLTTSFLRRLFTIKWVNSLLPFQKQQFLYKQSPTASCPSACGCTEEDWYHFPRCAHEQRRASWKSLPSGLAKVMERWKLDPSLRWAALHLISTLTQSSAIPIDNLADEYTMLIATQQSIGADSLLFGFFSVDWARLQERYLQAVGLPRAHNEASRAIRSLIVTFHDHCHSVWLLRNQHLHGTDPRNTTSYKHLHLLAQIQELYEAVPHMMSHDCAIFDYPLESRKLQSTSTLLVFFKHAKLIVDTSPEEASTFGALFQTIDQHFRPLIPQALFDIIL